MLNAKYEGILTVYYKINEAAKAGQVVMLPDDKANEVVISDGTAAYGFLAQDVYDVPKDEYRPLVGERAYKGELVGVYTQGGVYYTDQYVEGTYKPGEDLFVTSEGLLTNVEDEEVTPAPTKTTGVFKVGEVEYMDPVKGLRFKATI